MASLKKKIQEKLKIDKKLIMSYVPMRFSTKITYSLTEIKKKQFSRNAPR